MIRILGAFVAYSKACRVNKFFLCFLSFPFLLVASSAMILKYVDVHCRASKISIAAIGEPWVLALNMFSSCMTCADTLTIQLFTLQSLCITPTLLLHLGSGYINLSALNFHRKDHPPAHSHK